MNETEPTDIWKFVSGNETTIAAHLRAIAEMLPPTMRQRVQSTAQWIERNLEDGDPGGQHAALSNREVLAVLSPLLERAAESDNGEAIGGPQLLANLQIGVCRLTSYRADRKSIIGLFAYPGLLMVGIVGVVMLFSQMVVPNLRNLIAEFGIEMPGLTKAIFSFCEFFEIAWPLAVLCALLAALPMIVELCRNVGWVPRLVQWVDNRLSGRRLATARWARHTALLLQARVDQDAAIKTSMAAANSWIRAGSLPWRFGLLEETLKLDDRSAKIALLNQTADYYRAYHRSWVQWWASFLPTILVCLLGGFLVFVMLGIFMPLISIISGLTGATVIGLTGGLLF